MQRALLQWRKPEMRRSVIAALRKAGREDLIGFRPDCLIRPETSRKPTAKKTAAPPPEPEKKQKPQYKAGWARPKKKPDKKGKKR